MSSLKFLGLPIEIRNAIYERVLGVPERVHLFKEPGCSVENFNPGKPRQWLALLYSNRQISREASVILYRRNSFRVEEVERPQSNNSALRAFIEGIGPLNAASLSHIYMNFPMAETLDGEMGITEQSLERLQLIQRKCINLTTLETVISTRDSRSLIERDSIAIRRVLEDINREFRYIASLERIIVRVYGRDPLPSVKEFLQGLGWIVVANM